MGKTKVEQELLYDNLVSGDRPSILALGIYGAEAIKKTGMAVFMTDVLGRVQLLSPGAVRVVAPPKLTDEELDAYPEDAAIELLTKQGDTDDAILAYLKRRKAR